MGEPLKKKDKWQLRQDVLETLQGIAATQARQLELAEEQAKQTKSRIDRSIELQEAAVRRQNQALYAGTPIVLGCLGLIIYLIWRFL